MQQSSSSSSSSSLNKQEFTITVEAIGIRFNVSRHIELVNKLRNYLFRNNYVSHLMREQNQPFNRRLLLLSNVIVTGQDLTGLPKELQQELLQDTTIQVITFKRDIKYDYFNYDQIIERIIPNNTAIPHLFDKIGKIAIFNLSQEYLPYQDKIAQVYMDKHKSISTVLKIIFTQSGETQYKLLMSKLNPVDLNISVTQGAIQADFNLQHFSYSSRMQTQRERFMSLAIREFVEVGSEFPLISLQLAKRGIKSSVYYTGENNQRRDDIIQNGVKNHLSGSLNVIGQQSGDFNTFFEDLVGTNSNFSDILLTNHCFGLAFFLQILSIFGEYILKNEESQWKADNMPMVHFYIQQSAVTIADDESKERNLTAQRVYQFAFKSISQRIQAIAGDKSQLVISNFKHINEECNKLKLNFIESQTTCLYYLAIRIPHFTSKMDNKLEKSIKSTKRMDKNYNIWTSSLGSYHLNYGGQQSKQQTRENAFASLNRQESANFSSSLQSEMMMGIQSWSINEKANNWKNTKVDGAMMKQGENTNSQNQKKKKEDKVAPEMHKKKKITFGESLQGMMNFK